MIEDGQHVEAESRPAAQPPVPRTGVFQWVSIALLAAVMVLGAGWWRASRPVDRPLVRLSADLGLDAIRESDINPVITPDGNRIAFLAQSSKGPQIATQLLSESRSTMLPGTENATGLFFSPDGEWIGFYADSKLKKISVRGGAPVTLCDAPNGRG